MKVRYIYSACVVVTTPDLTICSDPWFSPGIYDGSWFQYPPLPGDPVEVIGPVDYVYLSHIHPDHYDPPFLRRYLAHYPDATLLIGRTEPPYLANKLRIDGFRAESISSKVVGKTHLHVFANKAYEAENIDTAMVVSHGDQSVVNMNDNPVDTSQIDAIVGCCPGGRATVALLPYSGAGPYPQTYEFEDGLALEAAADKKKEQFIGAYSEYLTRLRPRKSLPFAGKYWLGGPLAALNPLRGVPDAVEVLRRFPEQTIVLADGGRAELELDSMTASAIRDEPYSEQRICEHLAGIDFRGYAYEREIQPVDERLLPIVPLLSAAVQKARQFSQVDGAYWFCFKLPDREQFLVVNVARGSEEPVRVEADVSRLEPRCEVFIDHRYMFGLLTRLYHWNNAAIGSQYRCRRVPNTFKREVFNVLNHLHV